MKNKLIIPAIVLIFVAAACNFSLPGSKPQVSQTPQAQATQSIPGQAPEAQATQPGANQATQSPAVQQATQPVEITGKFSFSNDIILTYYVENAVEMTDMYGFVKRDKEWEVPVSSQTLGFLKIDPEKKTGTFSLQLPALPEGKQVSVNPKGPQDPGVQIFALGYSPNLAGGPYSEGDDPSRGWPTYLATVKTDSENKDEVTGGKLVIWAPDNKESFPSGFGADGLLFTQDDPVMSVPQGYSVIDLDQKPFKIIRDAQPEMTLYEPSEAAIKDFSKLSYREAFDKMFAMVRKQYAFNGISGKAPDWDKLYADLSPRIDQASQNKDPAAFFHVMQDFTLAFKDGHVGLDGGDVGQQILAKQYEEGGYGFAIRRLDDGRVMVVDVVQNSPAAEAGMKVKAVINQFNGKPINDAIQAVVPPGPVSVVENLRDDQARYLVRAPLGTKATVQFTNPGASAPQSADLTAIQERDSLIATSPYRNSDPNGLPVEYQVVTSLKVGYVKINSNSDDLNLIIRLFQRALTKFKENKVKALIIDMRVNSGGAPLGLSGFLTDKEITLGQLQYYNNKTGKFENEGLPDKFTANVEQFRFEKMFLLVDSACASACELESFGFSQVPGMVVVGEHPTSGTEADVLRGQFKLPEGMSLQIPMGRFVLPDGSLFMEGKGVQPTVKVPIDEQTAVSDQDPVIQKVIQLAGQ